MSKFTSERKSWNGARAEKQDNARAAKKELWQQRQANHMAKPIRAEKLNIEVAPALAPTPDIPKSPWRNLKAGTARLRYFSRTDSTQALYPQPWTLCITNTILEAAENKKTYLCLLWPTQPVSIVAFHAFAGLERNFAKDLKGLRSILFPGTSVSRTVLQTILFERVQMIKFYQSLWSSSKSGPQIQSHTHSASYEAMLAALTNLQSTNPELPNPSLGEVVPTFMFDSTDQKWRTVVENPLERSLRKVDRLRYRKLLRNEIQTEWTSVAAAPGALFVLHGNSKKGQWRVALTDKGLSGNGKPEVLLLDAISSASEDKQKAIKRIPEFLSVVQDNWRTDTGAVIFTDDPKTFFILRSRLAELKMAFEQQVWAGEGEEALLSATPLPVGWAPVQKSNTRFNISIVDRDAASIALTFQTIAHRVGDDENAGHRALMAACLYVLRLSNMPAGYKDLTEAIADDEFSAYAAQKRSWTPVELDIRTALATGVFGDVSGEVERAVAKAQRLIDDWTDATPMAQRLMNEIRKYAVASSKGITVVLPDQRTIGLAVRFLQRQLCDEWPVAEAHIHWQSHSSLKKSLGSGHTDHHYVFVGTTPDIQRIVLADPHIPHDSAILLPYRQAENLLRTLEAMKTLEALKPYRGRIGLLIQELERRLKEVPNPIKIERLAEFSMAFNLEDAGPSGNSYEQSYYKFDLEGGTRAYASGWAYRFDPEEDPPFKRVAASQIKEGNEIFEMSDDLRGKIESALNLNADGLGSVAQPARTFLRLYQEDVQRRCAIFFTGITKRSSLTRAIYARMLELDGAAEKCRPGRVYYWLSLSSADSRPHAPRDAKFFKLFCRALEISDDSIQLYWGYVRNARRYNQLLGRQLAAQYAEIIFRPESAAIYRKIPQALIRELQQDALHCVHRIERIIPPGSNGT